MIVLRIKRPDAHRPFRVPFGFVFPVLGVLSCLYLMLSLSVVTWVRFLVWLDLGMMIYWFYGRTHSPLANREEQAAQSGGERLGNIVTMFGALGLFNGFFVTVLGYMTQFGITTEATTKWHEVHVTPQQADTRRPRRARPGRRGVRCGTAAGEVGSAPRGRLTAHPSTGGVFFSFFSRTSLSIWTRFVTLNASVLRAMCPTATCSTAEPTVPTSVTRP